MDSINLPITPDVGRATEDRTLTEQAWPADSAPVRRVRTIFLSDIHLGTRACQAGNLIDFLRLHTAEYLFLVGDIIDFWAMSRGVYWSAAQNSVVQKILRRARHGEKVFFIPGNHDEALREHIDVSFGEIRIVKEWLHTAANGRKYLLLHGDEFDQVTRYTAGSLCWGMCRTTCWSE